MEENTSPQEATKSNGRNGNNAGLIIACSVASLCAGAVLGLLYAPKPGKEVRGMISNSVRAAKAEFNK